jgi:hypothetical protein
MSKKKIRIVFWWGKLKRKRQLGRPKHGTNIDLSRNSGFIWLGIWKHGGVFGTVMNLLVLLIVCLRTCCLLNNNTLHGKMGLPDF